MIEIFKKINQIIADWDPIGVGAQLACSEYKGYVPLIIRSAKNKNDLMNCLEDILQNKIGLAYDANNEEHVSDLEDVCVKIMEVY